MRTSEQQGIYASRLKSWGSLTTQDVDEIVRNVLRGTDGKRLASLTPSEKQTCKDLDISKSDCEKVVQERAQQGAQYNSTEGPGIQQAQTDYENKFFSVKTPPSGFGAPQSGDVNLTWTFSPGPTIDIHSPYTQGYYKFYGISENYTKTHNISGVIIFISKSNLLLHQFDSDPVISVNGEQLTFTNGTKTTVPAESIDLRYGVQLK